MNNWLKYLVIIMIGAIVCSKLYSCKIEEPPKYEMNDER